MPNGNRRNYTTEAVRLFRDRLPSLSTMAPKNFFGRREIDLPFAGTGRKPFRMVYGGHQGDFMLISRPQSNQPYGLHPVAFNTNSGFTWLGDYLGTELPSDVNISHVCGGTHLSIGYKDSSGEQGVRIYSVGYAPTGQQTFPVIINLEHLHQYQEYILDMMSLVLPNNQGELLILTKECILERYLLTSQNITSSKWYPYDGRGFDPNDDNLNLVEHCSGMILPLVGFYPQIAVIVVPGTSGRDNPIFLMGGNKYGCQAPSTQPPFGNRNNRFFWYGSNPDPERWCEAANIYFTGEDGWIRAFELIQGTPRTMWFQFPDGSTDSVYRFPEGTNDWQIRGTPEQRGHPVHRRDIDLVRATDSGLMGEHFYIQILPEPGISIIHVGKSKKIGNGKRHAVLFDHFYCGVYSAGDDKLYYRPLKWL